MDKFAAGNVTLVDEISSMQLVIFNSLNTVQPPVSDHLEGKDLVVVLQRWSLTRIDKQRDYCDI